MFSNRINLQLQDEEHDICTKDPLVHRILIGGYRGERIVNIINRISCDAVFDNGTV